MLPHFLRNNFYFEAKALESVLITTHNVIRVISHIDENFEAGNSLNLPVNGGCRSTFAGKGLVKKYGGGGGGPVQRGGGS